MVTRPSADGGAWILVRQHDHGRAAGEIAAAWAIPGPAHAETVLAVANHDVAWEALDTEVVWDRATGRPLSFADAPPRPRLQAYRAGIDLVEAASGFAACLCSMHYASFFTHAAEGPPAAFVEAERARQRRLRAGMTPGQLESLPGAFARLQFCDDASLFICRNRPGRSEVGAYEQGIPLGAVHVRARWDGPDAVELHPSPLGREVRLSIPFVRRRGPDGPAEGGVQQVRVR